MKQHNIPFITSISIHFEDLDVIMPDKVEQNESGLFLWITHYIPGNEKFEYKEYIQLRIGEYPLVIE